MSIPITPFAELCKRIYLVPPTDMHPLSSFYSDDGLFIVEGRIWSSIVQYYYYKKFMYDEEISTKIVETHDIKKLVSLYGRDSIKQSQWILFRESVLKRAMYAKIEQNIKLYIMLMNMPDSALNSISDEIEYGNLKLKFELETSKILLDVKSYMKKYGHPLIDNKSGEYRPKVKEMISKYIVPTKKSQLSSSV